MSGYVDALSSLLSTVVTATQSAAANQRQMAVAVNAVKTEQATTATLIEAIQQSAAYGSGGQAAGASGTGTRFVATA